MSWLLGIIGPFGALSVSILGATLFGYGTRMGLWISHHAARLLPEDRRDRYREEWAAHIIDVAKGNLASKGITGNHHLAALLWGMGTVPSAVLRSNARRRTGAWLLTSHSDPLILATVIGLIVGAAVGTAYFITVGVVAGVGFAVFGGFFTGAVFRKAFTSGDGVRWGLAFSVKAGLALGVIFGAICGLWLGAPIGIAIGLNAAVPTVSTVLGPRLLRRMRARLTETAS